MRRQGRKREKHEEKGRRGGLVKEAWLWLAGQKKKNKQTKRKISAGEGGKQLHPSSASLARHGI